MEGPTLQRARGHMKNGKEKPLKELTLRRSSTTWPGQSLGSEQIYRKFLCSTDCALDCGLRKFPTCECSMAVAGACKRKLLLCKGVVKAKQYEQDIRSSYHSWHL
ncbi:uncharacterized protein LOC144341233 [Macaca mulatta]